MLILMSIIAYNSIIGHDRHIKFNLTFQFPSVKLVVVLNLCHLGVFSVCPSVLCCAKGDELHKNSLCGDIWKDFILFILTSSNTNK